MKPSTVHRLPANGETGFDERVIDHRGLVFQAKLRENVSSGEGALKVQEI
jgi:hypothetical protein